MTRVEDEPHEGNCLAFTQFHAVRQRYDICQLSPAGWRLTFGNRGFVVAGIAKRGEGLQRYGGVVFGRRAEIILHRILLIVSRSFETASVAAEEIYLLRFVGKRPELHRQRFAAGFEFQLLSTGQRWQQEA